MNSIIISFGNGENRGQITVTQVFRINHRFSVDVRIPAWDLTVIQQYRKEFNQFDVNKDGSLDKKEFIEWMKSTGSQAKVAKNIFEVVDRDGNECINFEEFATFAAACSEMVQNNDMNSYLTLLFKAADKHKLGIP